VFYIFQKQKKKTYPRLVTNERCYVYTLVEAWQILTKDIDVNITNVILVLP